MFHPLNHNHYTEEGVTCHSVPVLYVAVSTNNIPSPIVTELNTKGQTQEIYFCVSNVFLLHSHPNPCVIILLNLSKNETDR
jgi:hypothetical protein